MAPVFLVCVAAASRALLVNKAVLYFLLPAWHAIILNPLLLRSPGEGKEEMRPGEFACIPIRCMCLYVLLPKNVRSHVCVCLGSGVDGGLRRKGGSATALTDFQAPRQNRKTPASPLRSPLQRPTPDSTQHPRNKHKLPLFSSTWLAAVVQDVW